MTNIYISHTHNGADTEIAERIRVSLSYRGLESVLTSGAERRFFYDSRIALNTDTTTNIQRCVKQSDIMVVLIGRYWLGHDYSASNKQQLKEPFNLVTVEIYAARQQHIPIIPVLVDDAVMPNTLDLPEFLQFLTVIEAGTVSRGRNFEQDVSNLFKSINNYSSVSQEALPPTSSAKPPPLEIEAEEELLCYSPVELPPLKVKENVHLGVAVPPKVSPGEYFVVRFAAYTASAKDAVEEAIQCEAPSSQQRLGLDVCCWKTDTLVSIYLEASGATIANPVQTFLWREASKIVRFDVTVDQSIRTQTLILRFNVVVEGMPVTALRPEISVVQDRPGYLLATETAFVQQEAPRTAFASYSTGDRQEVMGRVRSLQIYTGIDVFMDCLSLTPSEKWKSKLHAEICRRELFLLFWSRNAMRSKWVDWEWRTALQQKTLDYIQPHPLEPLELAPAPTELSDLQFGNVYEWYLEHLRKVSLANREVEE